MYICPLCNHEFMTKEEVAKHNINCWRKRNPNHKSNPAPHSEDTETHEVNENVLTFFNLFKGK